jgi:hypothetical protein
MVTGDILSSNGGACYGANQSPLGAMSSALIAVKVGAGRQSATWGVWRYCRRHRAL